MRIGFTVFAAFLLVGGAGACGGSDGNDSAAEATAERPTNAAVSIQITSPANGGSVRADRVTVRGTVAPADAAVQIVGRSAQVGNGVFTGSVPLKRGQNTIDVVASAEGAAPASETIIVTRPALRATRPAASQTPSQGDVPFARVSNCGDGLTAGARTSCPFAENVRASYEQTGAGVLEVHSPTTGQTYRMYCTSGSPHVCSGGNGASVYFFDRGVVMNYETDTCGGNLVVGPNTTCGFAENVRAEYLSSGPGWINVHSPATGRTYAMYCTATSPHVCTGGNDAAVYFP